MKIIKQTKRKTITEVITYNTNADIKIKETFVDGKKKNKLEVICSKKKYTPVFLKDDAFTKKAIDEYEDFYSFIRKYYVPLKSIDDINNHKLYFAYYDGHMLFDSDWNIVSIPYIASGYIGALREKTREDKIYKKIIDLLKKHPFVLELKEEEIPYYNRDFSYQKAIDYFKILLPDELYKKLYEFSKDDEHWSCRMGDAFKLCSWVDFDIYGEEINNLAKKQSELISYNEDDEDDY